jgi:putative glutamine amidotransferase
MIKIGITITEAKYSNYPAWIKSAGRAYDIVELDWEKNNAADLELCHGLLLSGGVDIDTQFHVADTKEYPLQPAAFNSQRDQFEMGLFKAALKAKIPVLGICRGLQLINISLGGKLVLDIESSGKPNHRAMNGVDHVHQVALDPASQLAAITGCCLGTINSAHHQAVLEPASELKAVAFSKADGIIESLEWKDPTQHGPMVCVQWHPERMANKENEPLSQNILEWFLEAAKKYQHEHH